MLGENSYISNARIHGKEMSNEIVKWESPLESSVEQKRESLLEKAKLVQQRKSLTASGLAGKAFLTYHEVAPVLSAFANNMRSSVAPGIVPKLTKQAKRLSMQQPLRDSLQARGFLKQISQAITNSPRTSAASKDWELNLINGLLGDHETHQHFDSEEWRRFTLTGFSDNESLKLTLPEPESIPLPPSPKLDVQRIFAKPNIRVVQAVQVSEEILDEFDYDSDSDVSEEAPDSDTRSFESSNISPTSIKETSEIKVESESWPLPADGIPASLSPTTPLPDPLRCNPPERTVAKSRSHQTLRSVRSNRSNRKAFVMQQNESSVSVHSLGTTTTKSISDIESALDTGNTSGNVYSKNRKFPLYVFGHLKRSNASRASPGFSMLTPVAETFEKARKGSKASVQANVNQADSKSAQSSIAERKPSRFVFQGALVRRGSRRSAGRV